MTVQTENKALWQSWVGVWNGNLALADAIITPDFVAHFVPLPGSPGEVRGAEGLKQWIGPILMGFSNVSFTTDIGPLEGDDKIAGRWIFRGTYNGGMPGVPAESVGKSVEYAGVDILRIENGKIAEYWLSADILQLLQQLGVA